MHKWYSSFFGRFWEPWVVGKLHALNHRQFTWVSGTWDLFAFAFLSELPRRPANHLLANKGYTAKVQLQ